jgi:nucleoside 2-deoxyribosyltransferase
MRLFFLSAAVPLTKSFARLPTGEIEKSAYPLVKNFTSHEETVDNPKMFHAALMQHAAFGHCLLKGQLKRPLVGESRAGTTSPLEPTRWSCFDLDNMRGLATTDEFIREVLPSAFHHVDYILQYSASAGIIDGGGLRAHLFFMHDAEFTPEAAKLYITELNLTHPLLAEQLELTASGTALRYPLDRTVMQNDKLIYIAPPTLEPGIIDTLGPQRLALVVKGRESVAFDWRTQRAPAGIEGEAQTTINRLRERAGLKKKTAKVVVQHGELMLTNPDVAVVTGERRARGFVYLNLNGGDSWGYYYNEANPRYLRNFKGEPMVVLKDALPAYYSEVAERLAENKAVRVRVPFAFRHRETDTIWNGVYDAVNDRIEGLAPTSRQSLKDFFAQFDEDVPQIDDWRFEFEPNNPVRIDFKNKFCNLWEPTEYMRAQHTVDTIPPTINRVLWSVVGNDEECYHHLVNWLAFVFQRRQKPLTAWILHGVPGTGKGVLFHKVLTPLFGRQYCLIKQIAALEDRFNAEMQHCLLFLLDETKAENSVMAERAFGKLSNLITEPMLEVRALHRNSMQVPSFTAFLFYSNNYDAWKIEPSDRRFNVAPRQENRLLLSDADLAAIETERDDFAAYLRGYAVDAQRARTALNNEAKAKMREHSQDALEQMCQAITDGDLAYFMSYAEGPISANSSIMAWSNYIELMKRWVEQTESAMVIRREDVLTAYVYLMAPPQMPGAHKFTRMLAHKNLVSKPQHCPTQGRTVRGFKTHWRASPAELAAWRELLKPKGEKQPQGSVANLTEWKRANQ